MCVFVSLCIKAVHIEAVSDLTSEAFIAYLERFTSRREKPTLLWSDHGMNFVGVKRILKDLVICKDIAGMSWLAECYCYVLL